MSSLSPSTTPLSERLPQGTWDTHMHVLDPRFPLSPSASYTPSAHTLDDAKPFYDSTGIRNLVLVQPSIYGTDNACLLSALEALGPRGRAVVEIDPSTTPPSTLRSWHALGVRGVRINLRSRTPDSSSLPPDFASTFAQETQLYADLIRPLNWSLHFHISLDMVPLLAAIAPSLNVKLCIDHFGSPDLPPNAPPSWHKSGPWGLPGFLALVNLLRDSRPGAYVKISAPYRFSGDKEMKDIEVLTRALMDEAPERCVFATDWPHTRFEGVNVVPFMEGLLRWAERVGGEELVERVFRGNAERLLDG
jgi:predicted TIM-barrel fold metal-dependent hydrolase